MINYPPHNSNFVYKVFVIPSRWITSCWHIRLFILSKMSTSIQNQAVVPGSAEYETLRTRYFHSRVPNTQPSRIYTPRTTLEVAEIINQARINKWKVGVRSGGHLFPCCSLVQDGVLIDTCYLNQGVDYDRQTQLVSFPPGARSRELATAVTALGRFFPWGHAPTVGVGGFLLAGGQGWFMRGWGCTSDTWVVRMEIVTPDGRIVQASKTENDDIFWAARGSGQGFFGVVTRIWGRTIPTRRLWETAVVFDGTDSEAFSEILAALFEVADRTPKHGIDMAFATFRPDRDEPGLSEEVHDNRIFVVANAIAFADSLAEAEVVLSPWTNLPEILKKHLIATVPVEGRTWDDVFNAQDKLIPYGNGERWQCDSILDRPGVAREEVCTSACIDAIAHFHSS